jgi:L-ribulose-5-phosphate 3-epimerase
MKIGVLLRVGERTLDAVLEEAAQLKIEGVQLYVHHTTYDLLAMSENELEVFASRCRELNLEIPALCGELGGHGFEIAAENSVKIAQTCRIIDLAKKLNVPVVTTHIGVIPEDTESETYQTLLAALTEMGEYAEKCGIMLAIETGPETPEVLKDFIERTNGGVGVNFDPANLVMVQNCDVSQAAEILASHIVHTHAKDGICCQKCDPKEVYNAFAEGGFEQLEAETGELFREVPLGEGTVNFPRYLATLRKHGYNGFLTIEREVGVNPMLDIKLAVDFLRKQLA